MSDDIEFEEMRRQALSLSKEQRDDLSSLLEDEESVNMILGPLSRMICPRCRFAFTFYGESRGACSECGALYSISKSLNPGEPCPTCGSTIHELHRITWRTEK